MIDGKPHNLFYTFPNKYLNKRLKKSLNKFINKCANLIVSINVSSNITHDTFFRYFSLLGSIFFVICLVYEAIIAFCSFAVCR